MISFEICSRLTSTIILALSLEDSLHLHPLQICGSSHSSRQFKAFGQHRFALQLINGWPLDVSGDSHDGANRRDKDDILGQKSHDLWSYHP